MIVAVLISAGLVLTAQAVEPCWGLRSRLAISALAQVGLVVVLLHAAVLSFLATGSRGGWVDLATALALPWFDALILAAPDSLGLTVDHRRKKTSLSIPSHSVVTHR